jgi:hypothetical protein
VTSCVWENWLFKEAVHKPMPVTVEGTSHEPLTVTPFTEMESTGLQPGVQPEVSLLQRSSQTWYHTRSVGP